MKTQSSYQAQNIIYFLKQRMINYENVTRQSGLRQRQQIMGEWLGNKQGR